MKKIFSIAAIAAATILAASCAKEGEGTTTGTFQQEGSDALTAPLTAYYPASVVAEDKSLVWPATQEQPSPPATSPAKTSSYLQPPPTSTSQFQKEISPTSR